MTPLLTADDLARMLDTTPRKIGSLVKCEGLPAITVPRVGLRFDPVAVHEWVQARRSSGAQPTEAA